MLWYYFAHIIDDIYIIMVCVCFWCVWWWHHRPDGLRDRASIFSRDDQSREDPPGNSIRVNMHLSGSALSRADLFE